MWLFADVADVCVFKWLLTFKSHADVLHTFCLCQDGGAPSRFVCKLSWKNNINTISSWAGQKWREKIEELKMRSSMAKARRLHLSCIFQNVQQRKSRNLRDLRCWTFWKMQLRCRQVEAMIVNSIAIKLQNFSLGLRRQMLGKSVSAQGCPMNLKRCVCILLFCGGSIEWYAAVARKRWNWFWHGGSGGLARVDGVGHKNVSYKCTK